MGRMLIEVQLHAAVQTNAIATVVGVARSVGSSIVMIQMRVSMELAAWIQRPRLVATATTGGDAIHTEEHVPLNTFRAVTDAQLGAAGAER